MSNNWKERRSRALKQMRNDWLLYLLLVPVLAWYIIFCYLPMAGVTLAFRDYSYKGGLWGSEWIGLANFTKMFSDPLFFRAVKNTIIFSLGRIAFQMPCAVLLAIALNELRLKWAKKTVQTIVTFPHFISWVVLAGMLMNIFGSTGTVNQILSALGVSNIAPITSSKAFRAFIWISGIWKEVGWNSIIYLAAITSIDPGLYEAAAVDGAGRLRQTWSITLPCIINTITFIIIMRASSIMGSDTEQVLMFYSPIVYGVGDVLGTFVYREGIENAKFSYTTAVGLFGSVVGMIMMLGANYVSRKYTDKGIW